MTHTVRIKYKCVNVEQATHNTAV